MPKLRCARTVPDLARARPNKGGSPTRAGSGSCDAHPLGPTPKYRRGNRRLTWRPLRRARCCATEWSCRTSMRQTRGANADDRAFLVPVAGIAADPDRADDRAIRVTDKDTAWRQRKVAAGGDGDAGEEGGIARRPPRDVAR